MINRIDDGGNGAGQGYSIVPAPQEMQHPEELKKLVARVAWVILQNKVNTAELEKNKDMIAENLGARLDALIDAIPEHERMQNSLPAIILNIILQVDEGVNDVVTGLRLQSKVA